MMNNAYLMEEFNQAPSGSLIMTGKLYREKFSQTMSEAAFSQAVSRLCKSGQIERISKGIYCRPKKSRFGTILPSDQEIVNLFTAKNNGVMVGYSLYNSLGVTTQISKRLVAYSSVTEEKLKQIGNVTIHKYDLEYTPATKSIICMMELLLHYKLIQDVNVSAIIHNIEKLAKEYNEETFEIVQKTIGYPKWTIAFLREVLNYYQTPNHLNRYLSTLSNYNIPRMEELYESARKRK